MYRFPWDLKSKPGYFRLFLTSNRDCTTGAQLAVLWAEQTPLCSLVAGLVLLGLEELGPGLGSGESAAMTPEDA